MRKHFFCRLQLEQFWHSYIFYHLLPDCEDCRSFFITECEVHGSALFIHDTPIPMGAVDRAKQTLPLGLEILKSSISGSGLGVFNEGETIPVGAHFGPYQGDLVERDEAMSSVYSWVVSYFCNRIYFINNPDY